MISFIYLRSCLVFVEFNKNLIAMDLGTNSRCQVKQQFILDFSCVVIYS